MPSQRLGVSYYCEEKGGTLVIDISYDHPTKQEVIDFVRQPLKRSFSQKYFEKELEAYVVQEAMSHLMDNRHTYDWVE